MLKKTKLLGIIPFILVSLAACGGNPGPGPDPTPEEKDTCAGDPVYNGEDVNVSKIVSNDFGKNIQVEGKDFLFMGTQIRVDAFMNCDKYTYADIKNLFKEASKLGVTCVQIPVEWSKIELSEDNFNFKYVHEMLCYANEFDLKVELLWFGSNMCGDTHSYSVPNYILADGRTYPKFDALRTGEFWNYYGIQWYLDFNNPNLIKKETYAVSKLMDYIYWFDSTHGAKKPVIGIQVENEADIFPRFRIPTYDVKSRVTGETMTFEEGFTKICDLLDAVGKEVKKAKYKVYTRANMASSTEGSIYEGKVVKPAPEYVQRIAALEGIDIVGDDSYTSSVKNIKGISDMFANIPNNFSHIAENAGNYDNAPSLLLTAASQHAGYSIYDLMTSPFYIDNGTGDVDQGIIQPGDNKETFKYRSFYENTKTMISGLKKVSKEIYKLSKDDFIAFNVDGNSPKTSANQQISSTNVTIDFVTNAKAIGYGLDFGTYIDIFLTQDSKIKVSNGTVSKVEKGEITDTGFNASETLTYSDGVNLTGGNLYRISYTSSGKIASTTWSNIGAN